MASLSEKNRKWLLEHFRGLRDECADIVEKLEAGSDEVTITNPDGSEPEVISLLDFVASWAEDLEDGVAYATRSINEFPDQAGEEAEA